LRRLRGKGYREASNFLGGGKKCPFTERGRRWGQPNGFLGGKQAEKRKKNLLVRRGNWFLGKEKGGNHSGLKRGFYCPKWKRKKRICAHVRKRGGGEKNGGIHFGEDCKHKKKKEKRT